VENQKNSGFAMSSVAATLAKFSMDVCLYMSQGFDFITLPAILPQVPALCLTKKTGCFELIRGKCNKIQSFAIRNHFNHQ
jgi:argininosuccinate lyase